MAIARENLDLLAIVLLADFFEYSKTFKRLARLNNKKLGSEGPTHYVDQDSPNALFWGPETHRGWDQKAQIFSVLE